MKKQPTAELDGKAHDMLMFYLQERNINIADIDHIEVELKKNREEKKYYRLIKIIKRNNESKSIFGGGSNTPEKGTR